MAQLLAVNVGLPREIAWKGKTVRTAVWKDAVTGRRKVGRLNVDGDGQADLRGHGGEHRAVFVYQIDSYRYWEKQLGRKEFVFGQFGENFTVEGLPDDEVSIGDRYRIGSALFEVTQPRVTCYRVGIRMDEPRMPALLVEHHRPGFYFRVLEAGEVGAGDAIVKMSDGPERMSVAEADALLYLKRRSRAQLERALRIPALPAGWRSSFQALLQQGPHKRQAMGNPGLSVVSAPPAWTGFRPMRVSRIDRESASVFSLVLVSADGEPLAAPLPGQFVVLSLQVRSGAPPVLRSYSLSGMPGTGHYRVSVKQEENGLASTYLHTRIKPGSILEVSAPRGSFTLGSGSEPVVLLSAGVGATPVLAMLHALAAEKSSKPVWWLYGARNREEHPFREESRALLQELKYGRSYIQYSRPGPADRRGVDFDAAGHLTASALDEVGVPQEGQFYLCGPQAFLRELTDGLAAWGVASDHIHTEIFGALDPITPGMNAVTHSPHLPAEPAGSGPQVSFARSGLTLPWDAKYRSLLELAEACDVAVRWSCRSGVCHTCETALIAGKVEYDPEPLEPPAKGDALICCCRPGGEVVLDL
ncbi:MAG TPA: MOSC and FAD-binding oxidoreductase domain-containing protein [Candidatus Acidoferrum sp.]